MRFLALTLLVSGIAQAKSIKDYDFYNYDVFFTNPQCEGYEYDETVYSNEGDVLRSKPENVYCKRGDKEGNQKREASPHFNLRKLIENEDVNEMFLTFLSFSNSDIADALCDAIESRNLKVTFIIDKGSRSDDGKRRNLDKVAACRAKNTPENEMNIPRTEFRGQVGGLGYAHNKIIIAKYKSNPKKTTLVFASGNMSSGTVLHHENWHFLTTSTDSYISQVHECIAEGMLDHSHSVRASRRANRSAMSAMDNFKNFMSECRSKIQTPEEEDIKTYVVPSDGDEAMENIVKGIKAAEKVDVAVHRFTHPDLRNAMKDAAKKGKRVRMVADDDIYWVGENAPRNNGRITCRGASNVGANMCNEYFYMRSVESSGVDVRFMETNHNVFLLHHNKYIIFDYADESGRADGVHCGAGNFTQAAFSKNFENFYYITVPEVVEKFKAQYEYKFTELATAEEDMPDTMVMP